MAVEVDVGDEVDAGEDLLGRYEELPYPVARMATVDTVRIGLTVLFDHDVTDGVPVALFLRRLTELMETAWGLDAQAPAPGSA